MYSIVNREITIRLDLHKTKSDLQTISSLLCGFLGANTRRIDSSKQIFEREVLLGHSAQDVATALGAPCRVFYKSEDKMRIHSPNAHRRVTACKSDYFFNYFTLGMVSILHCLDFIQESRKSNLVVIVDKIVSGYMSFLYINIKLIKIS